MSRPTLGVQPASYMSTWGSFPRGTKRAEREADHSPPSSEKVKYAWSFIFTHIMHFQGMLLRHGGL